MKYLAYLAILNKLEISAALLWSQEKKSDTFVPFDLVEQAKL